MASQPPNKPVPLAIQNIDNDQPLTFDGAYNKLLDDVVAAETKRAQDTIKAYAQAEAISVVAGELSVNTKMINELARQLRYNNDCEILKMIIKQHMDSLKNLVKDTIKEQLQIKKKFLPIIKPPSPTPWSIVNWIKKLIFGTSFPQVKAFFNLIKQIIALASAVVKLVTAVKEAVKNAVKCADQLADVVKEAAKDVVETAIDTAATTVGEAVGTAIAELDTQLDGAITGAVQAYKDMSEIVGVLKTIDTSSPAAFIKSFDEALTELETAGETFITQPDTTPAAYPVAAQETGPGTPPATTTPTAIILPITNTVAIAVRDGYVSEVVLSGNDTFTTTSNNVFRVPSSMTIYAPG